MRLIVPLILPLIPLASRWVLQQETIMNAKGRSLNAAEMSDARSAGVQHPERIRIMAVPVILPPQTFPLALAGKLVNLIGPQTAGITLRYGIYIREDCSDYRRNRNLYVHEFVHVGQYERLGSVNAFLKKYLRECLVEGYPFGPLEQEAIREAQRITDSKGE